MCVIALCADGQRLTEDQVKQMYEANPSGAGIAWRGVRGDNTTVVRWEKGLDLKQILELSQEVPLPYTAHFRIPTVGPREGIFPPLTHPFPIDAECATDSSGETESNLLFHNGVWNSWEFNLKDCAFKGGYKIPWGKWSDSRAMAFTAHCLGLGVLDLINEKAVVFGPANIWMVAGGWTLIQNQIWVSNLGWRDRSWVKTTKVEESSSDSSKEDHSRSHLEAGNESGDTSNQTTKTANTGTNKKATTRWTNNRVPSNWDSTHLPSIYQGTRGAPAESPFGPKGKILIPVTHEVMADAEARYSTKDQSGNRLLSKRMVKRYRRAYMEWCKAERAAPLMLH